MIVSKPQIRSVEMKQGENVRNIHPNGAYWFRIILSTQTVFMAYLEGVDEEVEIDPSEVTLRNGERYYRKRKLV